MKRREIVTREKRLMELEMGEKGEKDEDGK